MKYMPLVFIVAMIAIYSLNYNVQQLHKEYAKQGLEQCMQDSVVNNKVIWVRSCPEYLKSIKGH